MLIRTGQMIHARCRHDCEITGRSLVSSGNSYGFWKKLPPRRPVIARHLIHLMWMIVRFWYFTDGPNHTGPDYLQHAAQTASIDRRMKPRLIL